MARPRRLTGRVLATALVLELVTKHLIYVAERTVRVLTNLGLIVRLVVDAAFYAPAPAGSRE